VLSNTSRGFTDLVSNPKVTYSNNSVVKNNEKSPFNLKEGGNSLINLSNIQEFNDAENTPISTNNHNSNNMVISYANSKAKQ